MVFKKLAGTLVHLDQFSALVRVLGFLFRAVLHFGQLDVELFRNQPDGFDKADVLDLLHETEYVARSATTETMVELPRSMHRERRRLLLMEGAKPGEILRAALLQLDVVANHADDIRLLSHCLFDIGDRRHEMLRTIVREQWLERYLWITSAAVENRTESSSRANQ